MADPINMAAPLGATGLLVLASGQMIWGRGFGAEGSAVGEVCFNTAMTGYQEILTDPSYARQIITFTFPHIGNVGTNDEDFEADSPHALGCIVREDVTAPSNFRSTGHFAEWMKAHGRIGLAGVDTRALTRLIRTEGAPNAVIAHNADGEFDVEALLAMARDWAGLEGADLAGDVTCDEAGEWTGGIWTLGQGHAGASSPLLFRGGVGGGASQTRTASADRPHPNPSPKEEGLTDRSHIVAIDYGAKRNIFRSLVKAGAKVTVVPAQTSFDEIMAHNADGVFLSNGPGDPAATGVYAVPVIQALLEVDMPIFGICLGHQMLALAAGAKTLKMFQGHRGANHPVQRDEDGAVEITSMNHGFAVDGNTLPDRLRETHKSLFDGSNCGIEVVGKRAFGVQYHPEASPGPQDSFYLFEKFVGGLG
ncbi:MAG: glutamine-hydrolyzing carbamoyl-phosphate synthase small subunit [Sphingorhabdus sp.]